MAEQAARGDWKRWLSLALSGVVGAWGIWEFVLKEVVLPGLTPANINTEVEINVLPTRPASSPTIGAGTIPVEVSITAKSTGKQQLRVVSPFWIAYGNRLQEGEVPLGETQEAIASQINENLSGNQANPNLRPGFFRYGTYLMFRDLVGAGTLFFGEEIRPDQVIRSRRIIYVPPGEYDSIEIHTYIPTIKKVLPSDRWDRIQFSLEVIPPFYKIRSGFCKERASSEAEETPRSILDRVGVSLGWRKPEVTPAASPPQAPSCKFLKPHELARLGAQVDRSIHEKALPLSP